MNTTEFSELLKTLLDDVHSRVVEQYSKAEAVSDKTPVASVAKSETRLPTTQQTSSSNGWTMPRRSSSVLSWAMPTRSSSALSYRQGAHTPDVSTMEDLYFGPVPTPSVDADIGRCFTVPVTETGTESFTESFQLGRMMSKKKSRTLVLNQLSKLETAVPSRWVLNPERRIMQWWFCLSIMAVAFVALVTPIQVAFFMKVKLDTMFVVNCIIDCIFIVDMILQFFLMYQAKTGNVERLEYRHSRIVQHYLKAWFLIDLISVLPYDLLAVAIRSNDLAKAKGVKIIRLLRLIKMVRIVKFFRIFNRLEMSGLFDNAYQMFKMYRFIIYLVLISHWLACLWVLTLSLVDDASVRWVDAFEDSELGFQDSIWKLYVAALYFTAYTMTSVGYGDVTPVNTVERIVCTLILFISGLVWACVIGEVASIFSNLDAHEKEFRSLMDNLNGMMRDRQLPRQVRTRLKAFFLSARQARRIEQQEQIIRRLSPVLQGEVALLSNWQWVSKVSFIYNLMPEARSSDATRAPHFVVDIALELESAVFAQSEVFGEPRVLYILKQGLVLSRARGRMKAFRTGDVWGEDFVLSNDSLRESEARLAITYVSIFQLTFANFLKVCQRHSSNLVFFKGLRRFVARLSARRAILVEASRRRLKEPDFVSATLALRSQKADESSIFSL